MCGGGDLCIHTSPPNTSLILTVTQELTLFTATDAFTRFTVLNAPVAALGLEGHKCRTLIDHSIDGRAYLILAEFGVELVLACSVRVGVSASVMGE